MEKGVIMEFKREFPGTASPLESDRERENRRIAYEAALEGMVLLKNSGTLPLDPSAPLALFGAGAAVTLKGGTGSGDVRCRKTVSVYEGLAEDKVNITSKDWLNGYLESYNEAREIWKNAILSEYCEGGKSFFDVYSKRGFVFPDGPAILPSHMGEAKVAVYVISRTAGEGRDRTLTKGDWYLSDREREDIKTLCELSDKVVILINAGAQIDITELCDEPKIGAILLISQSGMEGGRAVRDVLLGKCSPSGKLTDTWACSYRDFPAAESFGKGTDEVYSEGIFVGYRYFDSFGVKPLFPFGYGLSYTKFFLSPLAVTPDGKKVNVFCSVSNMGHFPGKETSQVYAALPGDGQEIKRLVAYGKTDNLYPGQRQELALSFAMRELASFHDGRWVIAAGEYPIFIGSSSAELTPAAVLTVEKDAVLGTVSPICPPREPVKELAPPEYVRRAFSSRWAAELAVLPHIKIEPAPERVPETVFNQYEELAAALTDEELCKAVIGELARSQDKEKGVGPLPGIPVPGAAAETTYALLDKGVPPLALADGPAGLRLNSEYYVNPKDGSVTFEAFPSTIEDGFFAENSAPEGYEKRYMFPTAFPVGVMLAQTWNRELVRRIGEAVGREMREFGVSLWLAPGMNIHRDPLCGRNFEYYSEDPLISGLTTAAMTQGVQSVPGTGVTIKHFAANSREDCRQWSDSIMSERTLREIYLRGFEIAIKEAAPKAIMTSYNLINGVHTANSYDLCTVAAREEWGFGGLIMTDWLTTTTGPRPSTAWGCIKAGNDLIMPGVLSDMPDILAALGRGELKREELIACAARIIRAANELGNK